MKIKLSAIAAAVAAATLSMAADAATIDGVYLRHQKTAHDAALALHRAYSTTGDTDSLKKAAGEIVPVVETHIAELQKLSAAETTSAR